MNSGTNTTPDTGLPVALQTLYLTSTNVGHSPAHHLACGLLYAMYAYGTLCGSLCGLRRDCAALSSVLYLTPALAPWVSEPQGRAYPGPAPYVVLLCV